MGIVKKEGIRNTIIYYSGVVLAYFTMVILLPKVLLPDQFGLIRILIPYAAMLAYFFLVGMPNVMVRFFPYLKNAEKGHNGILFFAFSVAGAGILVTSVVFYIFKDQILHFYAPKAGLLVQYYYLLYPLAISITIFEIFSAYCRAQFKTNFSVFLNEVYVRILVLILAVCYFYHLFNFQVFVYLFIGAYLTNPVLMLLYTWWNKMLFIKPTKAVLRSGQINQMLNYGLFNFFGGATGVLMDKLDIVFIPGLLNLAYTGIYGIAVMLGQAVALPAKALLMILYPLTTDAFKENDREKLHYLYTTSCNVQLFVGGFTFLMIWVNFDSVFNILHPSFLLGKYAFLFLGIGKLFDMATGINGPLLSSSKYYRYDLAFTISLVILTIVTVNLFVPLYGIAGAGLAIATTSILNNIVKSVFVWRTLRLQPFNMATLRIFMAISGIFVVSMLLPASGSFIFDILYKSTVIGFLFLMSLLYLNITPEISTLAISMIERGKRIAKRPFGKK